MLPLLSNRLACGSGCGDVYWGEWVFNPPECGGPCDDGCWAGSGCDGCYAGYGAGYGAGCGQGLLAGPVAVIQGTYLGVSNLLYGTCATLRCGYQQALGCGYNYGPATACGCPECSGTYDSPACSSCGAAACNGDCAQSAQAGSRQVVSTRPLGSGVQPARAEQAIAGNTRTAQPPHRLVTKRLRR